MFSASLEVVLTIAYREAVSRRHAYLTLEHLLYALAHDPEGERILQGCGDDLPRLRKELNDYLDGSIEQLRRGQEREPEQTAAFRRVLQTAVLHVQSAQRQEVQAGRHSRRHSAAAEGARRAAARRAGHHAAGRARIHLARHLEGLELPARGVGRAGGDRRLRCRGPGHRARSAGGLLREPDRTGQTRAARSADRANRGAAAHDRGALPAAEEQPRLRRRSRRRQDGDGRGPGDPAARRGRAGPARRRRGVLARYGGAARGHAVPRRLRGAVQGGDPRAQPPPARHPVHRRDSLDRGRRCDHGRHHGSGDAHQADSHGRRSPRHRLDDVRGVQAHREGPGAGPAAPADRDRGAVDRGDRPHPERPARALRGAPSRHVHRRGARGGRQARRTAPARLPPAGQRHRRDRRGRRGHAPEGAGARRAGAGRRRRRVARAAPRAGTPEPRTPGTSEPRDPGTSRRQRP